MKKNLNLDSFFQISNVILLFIKEDSKLSYKSF